MDGSVYWCKDKKPEFYEVIHLPSHQSRDGFSKYAFHAVSYIRGLWTRKGQRKSADDDVGGVGKNMIDDFLGNSQQHRVANKSKHN